MMDPNIVPMGTSPDHVLNNYIEMQEQEIAETLAPLNPRTTIAAWFNTLRAIEECINFEFANWDDEEFEDLLYRLRLTHHFEFTPEGTAVVHRLVSKFNPNFANRFMNLVNFGVGAAAPLAARGHFPLMMAFSRLDALMDFLQSRRRHFISLLYRIPTACRGAEVLRPYELLDIFIPLVENNCIPLYTTQCTRNVKRARAKLGLPPRAFVEIPMLDQRHLEPERAPLTGMKPTDEAVSEIAKEPQEPDRLFSAAELRNDILVIQAGYSEFDLAQTDFRVAAGIIRRLSTDFVECDFWVVISPSALTAIFDELKAPPALRSALLQTGESYSECLSIYAPFVVDGETYRSTVVLLSRFLYYWRGRTLEHGKRFQIRAGFLFEEAVAEALTEQGFVVQGEVRRINRHEFDVVTIRDGVIWNVQCKNNFRDLNSLEADPERFARYNYRLARAYENALRKELDREHLLKAELSLNEIQHVVVSRFPVVTDNPRFVPYSRIGNFSDIADELMGNTPFNSALSASIDPDALW